MTDHLRALCVMVEEPTPGSFYWVLMERTDPGGVFSDVRSPDAPLPSWSDALDAGVRELRRLARDPRHGPRMAGEDENADPVG